MGIINCVNSNKLRELVSENRTLHHFFMHSSQITYTYTRDCLNASIYHKNNLHPTSCQVLPLYQCLQFPEKSALFPRNQVQIMIEQYHEGGV